VTAADGVLDRVRAIAMALPEVTERPSHGSPAFFLGGKKTLLMFVDDHHGDGILGIWCNAAPGVQEELIAGDPVRYFRPPYVGYRGWVGVRLDGDPDWDEVAELVEDAWRLVAPKRLLG
jgi:hypothetical protein